MTPSERIDAGFIPFVECDHSGEPEWTPAHYRMGKIAALISCVVCLSSFDDAAVSWVTAQDASQRFGWSVVSSAPQSPTS